MKTRFSEIELKQVDKEEWRFYVDDDYAGRIYPTKADALADLERFAAVRGVPHADTLYAHAHELLTALQALVRWHDAFPQEPGLADFPIVKEAKAAIARARGYAP